MAEYLYCETSRWWSAILAGRYSKLSGGAMAENKLSVGAVGR